ncbi:hypothetical protein [Sphingomonas sp. CCH21-G11]|jgi:hypothetical protein|uniref:hypothetical protein n=1 Tax=Sphingomonas sp. CCH21-G11 TaxID=1768749 RepID=UPI000829D422|nr:hypothetical protein [Sphingomonas sp. CCH21-G11]
MVDFDIRTIRRQVRAMEFVRGTPAEVAMWHEDMADSRANLVIEDMIPTPNEDAFFAMMLEEAVPPELATQILLRLLDHSNADHSLPITPMTVAGLESR